MSSSLYKITPELLPIIIFVIQKKKKPSTILYIKRNYNIISSLTISFNCDQRNNRNMPGFWNSLQAYIKKFCFLLVHRHLGVTQQICCVFQKNYMGKEIPFLMIHDLYARRAVTASKDGITFLVCLNTVFQNSKERQQNGKLLAIRIDYWYYYNICWSRISTILYLYI